MIALACDHSALEMKKEIKSLLDEMGETYRDFGTDTAESCDYPVFGARAAKAVASGECEKGIVICGTGIGISLAANKVKGIRCALCSEPYSAELTRRHNDANMLALGARVIGPELAKMIVKTFLSTPFEGGRHQRRIDLIHAIEEGNDIE
ncbi:MAG: ribose 5-phosphate isomerase B [Clostridia bacterium]|nr:ribose 5-phosphate isomerase B [Clostridia bacterium]MBQ6829717.1 ribose 5-phosphate isomerase B [Clostridia bacterium]